MKVEKQRELSILIGSMKENRLHTEQVIFGLQPNSPLEPHMKRYWPCVCVCVRERVCECGLVFLFCFVVISERATSKLYLWLSQSLLKAKTRGRQILVSTTSLIAHI